MKNDKAKTREKDQPYEIYRNNANWEWRVLKHYQTPDKEQRNPYARVFCFVTSPYVPDGEYGDTYLCDIREAGGVLVPQGNEALR